MQTTKRKAEASGTQKVLIIYESIPARERAAFFCAGFFSQNSRATVHWCACPQLNEHRYADQMSGHALDADVVIFAGDNCGDLAADTKSWVNRWLGKRSREGVLVGLFSTSGTPSSELTSLKEIYLRHAAHQAGMDYLSQVPTGSRRSIPNSLDTYGQRAGQVTSLLHSILQKPLPPAPPL